MPLKTSSSTGDIVSTFNIVGGTSSVAWGTANTAQSARVVGSGLISKIGFHVTVQSGNICVAVYSSSGRGRDKVPATRIATSGGVACPATGYQELALDVPVFVTDGMFLAMSCDNTTAAFAGTSGTQAQSNLYKGYGYAQPTAYPLPSTATTLTASVVRLPMLVGVE